MGKTYQSAALAAVHEVALGLAEAGTMGKSRLRGFDALCLTPVEPSQPRLYRGHACNEQHGGDQPDENCQTQSRLKPASNPVTVRGIS
jgi:putative transcriptional regulator